jgi:hypothetical protein
VSFVRVRQEFEVSRRSWPGRVLLACQRAARAGQKKPLGACLPGAALAKGGLPVLLLVGLMISLARPAVAGVVVIARDKAFEATDIGIDAAGTAQVKGGATAGDVSSIPVAQLTLLMFDPLPSDAPVRAWLCLQDGRRLSGDSVTVDAAGVSLQISSGPAVTAALDGTNAVFFRARRPTLASPPAEGVRIVSTNGDVLNAPALDWTDAGLLVEVNPSLDPIPLPRDRIAAILWPVRTPTTASALSKEPGLPLVDLRTGERLAGRVTTLDGTVLKLETATGVMSVPRRDVEAIWFEAPKTQAADELVAPLPGKGERPSWRRGRNALGSPLRIDGRLYAQGFGVQAPGTVEIPVPVGTRWLVASIGPDADAARFARMTLELLVDGKQVVACDAASPGQAARRVAVAVKGAARVVLSVKLATTDPTGCLGDFADVFFIY